MNKIKKFFVEIYRIINRLPQSVRIEACSLCQLNCRDCFMRVEPHKYSIGNGYLKFEDYKNFIEKHPYIRRVELSLAGEIFLNPDLEKIIKFSYENDIDLTALNGVNFNTVSENMIETLVKYEFKGISISIDGASNETYSIYKRNGNFDKVIENIKKLNHYKNVYKSPYPVLIWQYIYFKHNLQEISQAINLAKELNFYYINFKSPWNKEVLCPENTQITNNSLIKNKKIKKLISNKFNICRGLYNEPQINWDGRILGCCCATRTKGGVNVFEVGLKNALKSEKIILMKDAIKRKKPPAKNIDCYNCVLYKKK